MRICLLGLPRCGSQYISGLIKESLRPCSNLAEPYTPGHEYTIIKEDEHLKIVKNTINFSSFKNQIEYVSTTLKLGRLDHSIIMKVFLTNPTVPFLEKIINDLQELNFDFLIVKRENIEHQLLSWLIAEESNKWCSLDGEHISPITITNIADADWLYGDMLKFDELITQFKINVPTIRYEHAIEDLFKYLKIPIRTHTLLKKQVIGDPYDMIVNANEVREHLKRLLNDRTIH